MQSAGIAHVYLMQATTGGTMWDGNGFDPTFDNYSGPPGTATTITTGTTLVFIDPTANPVAQSFIQSQYPSWSTTASYVAVGIGDRSTVMAPALWCRR